MKMFCQKCGKELNNSKICSDCGFENRVVSEKRWLKKTIQLLGIIIIIALGIFIFKDKLLSHYDDLTEKWRDDFKLAFAEYEFAEYSFETYDLSIYQKHIPEIEEIDNKTSQFDRAFFMCDTMKIDNECRNYNAQINTEYKNRTDYTNDLDKLIKIQGEWRDRLNNCGKDEQSFGKCKEYHELMDKYPPQKCKNCDEKISELYKIASAIKDSNTASKLFGLVDLLRQQQAFYDDEEFIKLPSLIFDQEYCMAAQSVKWVAVKKMSESEINKAVAGKDIKNKDIALHFIKLSFEREGRQFNKDNVLEEINNYRSNCNQKRFEYQKQLDDKRQVISGNLVKVDDYIAMLNGNLELYLKTWQSNRKTNN